MARFLMVDVGAGTMDILYYDDAAEQHYKAVVESPVRTMARVIENTSGNLILTGVEMGGGAMSGLLKARARNCEVAMSKTAAATLHHDMDKVASWGIRIVDEQTAEDLKHDKSFTHIVLADLDVERLENLVSGFGVPFEFDAVAACAQDHGVAPPGVSHLDYRHNLFTARLDKEPFPHILLYEQNEVPENLNRLRSMAATAQRLPTREVYVMDSGMAAILGASLDRAAASKERIMVLDVATSHTLGAALVGGELAGFFEYHTSDITAPNMEKLLKDLADGRLHHEEILAEGGHGAYTRRTIGFETIEALIATGPKRRLIEDSKLNIVWGAPMGDNMMTGTLGLLEALRRRKGTTPVRLV